MGKSANNVAKKKRHSLAGEVFQQDIITKEILNLFPGFIFTLSSEGTIIEVNQSAINALTMEEDRLLFSSFYDLCENEEQPRIRGLIHECLESGKNCSAQIKLVAGQERVMDVSLSRYTPKSDTAKHYCVLIGRDISREKEKELDLLRFSNIAHYTVNPIEITGPDGRIIYVNPAFEKASGYVKEEVIGKNPNVFSSGKHPKAFWVKMWETITSGKVWVGEIENRHRNGEPFFTHLLISPIIDGEGKIVGYFGVHRDISGQRHLEQQLVHAQKMESIGMLAAGIAHEVGNPLTSISSLVQVLQRETDDEFTQEKLELIKSQVTRIARIIRDLVDFSRRSSYEVQLTDINKGLREAVDIVRVGKKAKEISFQIELDEHLPKLPLVPDQIQQVFINILINAVDAIHSNTQSHRKAGNILAKSSFVNDNVIITIRDNGKGISEEIKVKIFEPFFTTKKVGEGTGLGLWVSYGIIKSFQGIINVESVENEGTIFEITLPLHAEIS
jgi:PAS domain S-box-containing protein